MNVHVNVSLDTRYEKKDGSYAVILRLSDGENEKTLPVPTGISVPIKYWDEKKREVKPSYKGVSSVTRLNNQIEARKKHARDLILQLRENDQLNTMSLMEVKRRIVQDMKGGAFFEFGDEQIEALAQANRIGSKNAYYDALKALENFHGSRKLDFRQITYEFLMKFETKHFEKGNGVNGLAAYMRTIRAIYNKGIKSGLVDEKYYPFKKYKIKTEETRKRALDWNPLKEIITKELAPIHGLFHARNYFVASYLMYGMNFTDMAFLTKDSIVNGRIDYRRSKTGKLYDIKVMPALQEILNYYIELHPDSEYVFPIVKRQTAELMDRDIKWARKRYNKKLKDVAELCEIETNLTSYVSRHSFATQAQYQNVPVTAISAMLGHSSLKTTEIYLKSLPTNVLDDFNEKILPM